MIQPRRATKEISRREGKPFGKKSDQEKLSGRASARLQSAMEHPKPLGKVSSKAQSAMEYLMTYSRAILVIAVVLGVMYYLGVFTPRGITSSSTTTIATPSLVATVPVGSGPEFATYNPSNNYVYVTNYYSDTVSVLT